MSEQRICLQGRQLPAAAAAAGRRARAGLQEVGRAGKWQPGRHHALTVPSRGGGALGGAGRRQGIGSAARCAGVACMHASPNLCAPGSTSFGPGMRP